jgi:SET domain-containing protein
MNKIRQDKVYVKESNVPTIGNGLFANTNIKKGSIIAEFKGKLRKPGENLRGWRSNIYFEDEYILECPDTDLASFANDAINFTKEHRQILKALKSNTPFYKKHKNALINAQINVNHKLHRAFLIASCDIKPNDEIFCHYGFTYWFKQEISTIGFLQEDEIEKNGFPDRVFDYPGFAAYIREFYPLSTHLEIKPFKDTNDVIIHFKDGSHLLMMIDDYSDKITRLEMD